MLEGFDPNSIADERARQCIIQLLNLIEELQMENRELRAEVQRLGDEINRLKREQGRPVTKPNKAAPAGSESANAARRTAYHIVAHKLAVATYQMWRHGMAYDERWLFGPYSIYLYFDPDAVCPAK